ncbi:PLP-dependent transferase [Streptomyces sp. T-3]|nr:PLP-dependent transferase [Streptomyces sp. T-3]
MAGHPSSALLSTTRNPSQGPGRGAAGRERERFLTLLRRAIEREPHDRAQRSGTVYALCARRGGARPAGSDPPPLYNHSMSASETTSDLLDVVEGRTEGNLYTRYGLNPTIRSVERKIADLEHAEAALAFSLGMAAEAATFLAHTKAGEHIVCLGDVYGGTFELLGELSRDASGRTDPGARGPHRYVLTGGPVELPVTW